MGSFLNITYEIAVGPAAMSWDEYADRARLEWNALLSCEPEEVAVQAFLERHPSFLPGFRSMVITSGHYPHPTAVLTQPRLNGLTTKIPDFMWIAGSSASIFPVLIEIEKPGKKWFKSNGDPTADFNHARNQLATWRNWFRDDANRRWFVRYYEISEHDLGRKVMEPAYVLIYGRRSEFEGHPDLNRLRPDLAGEDEYHMTFDRLEPDRLAEYFVTCRKPRPAGFEVVAVPPTLKWSPALFGDFARMSGWEEAIRACEWMAEPRREFLVERLAYWLEWRRTGSRSRSVIRTGDRE